MPEAIPEEKNKEAFIEFVMSRRSDLGLSEDMNSDDILECLHRELGAKFVFPDPVPPGRRSAKVEFEQDIKKELKKIRPRPKKLASDLIVFLLTFTFMTISAILLLPTPYDVLMGLAFLGIMIFGVVRDKRNNVRYTRRRHR